ncbi:MAG: TetR/AcrR family transcriptional regulator [Lapillicoccus sp.]
MTESTATRDRIIEATAQLMRYQGYGATSVKQVVEQARVTTGSLYHFFPKGKRQVAAAALQTTASSYIALVPLLMDPHDDLGDAVRAFFGAAADDMELAGWATMCPVGTVAAETADVEPALRAVCAEIVASWVEDADAYFVRRGLAPADAHTLTLVAFTALEGAFVLCRVLRSAEALVTAGDSVAAVADSMSRTRVLTRPTTG